MEFHSKSWAIPLLPERLESFSSIMQFAMIWKEEKNWAQNCLMVKCPVKDDPEASRES